MTITIAVDCMGGDHGVAITLPAALASLRQHPALHLQLFGDSAAVQASTAKWPTELSTRFTIVHTEQVVGMGEVPTNAYRKKRASSMRKAIDAVHDGLAHGMVSSGNTGALALTATLVLRPIDGLDRPAIAAYLPTSQAQPVLMLDLGANATCSADILLQFAVIGSALAQANGIAKPSIGLLNIGEELGKGNDTYKLAHTLMQDASEIHFYGNVEGTDIYKRTVDVVVCDGFVGNIVLKTSEGLASMLKTMITEEFTRHWWTKVLGALSYPILAAFKKRIDQRRFNGAILLGLNGIVIKSHGSADAVAFAYAIGRAYEAAQSKLVERLKVSLTGMAPASVSAGARLDVTFDAAQPVSQTQTQS
jgi:phosphate acyltransferase